jgi:hypothetical protein
MTRLGPNPDQWLPELRSVLTAIAQALGERSPSAPLIMALRPAYERCVSGHTVQIEYFPDGYTNDPNCLPEYAVSLAGDRLLSSWLLLERDLHGFLTGAKATG